ncbi:hypothetical protein CPB86DRAFT_812289 [Serendipita vermifera]|nr:hypothetical protein CPB86DRAFT_812289 [Serendipita vermifera]
MDEVLQFLQNRIAKPSLSQTKEGRLKTLPSLPLEIWLIIIQMALRPSLVVDAEFEPYEIEQACVYLDSWSKASEKAAQTMVSSSKRNLRRVCRLWKELVDSIDTSEDKWTWNMSSRVGVLPTDPHQYTRVDQYHYYDSGSQISRYMHPVSALMLTIGEYYDEEQPIPIRKIELKAFISFPEHLRVLNLQFAQCRTPKDTLRAIEVMRLPLTTLRVHTETNTFGNSGTSTLLVFDGSAQPLVGELLS